MTPAEHAERVRPWISSTDPGDFNAICDAFESLTALAGEAEQLRKERDEAKRIVGVELDVAGQEHDLRVAAERVAEQLREGLRAFLKVWDGYEVGGIDGDFDRALTIARKLASPASPEANGA